MFRASKSALNSQLAQYPQSLTSLQFAVNRFNFFAHFVGYRL
jgi:hypothetical protein